MLGLLRAVVGRRWRVRALAAGVLCALSLSASAQAGSNDIWNGVLYTDAWGPQHSLTSVWATWYYNSKSCLNALNSDGSGWAGETYCAWFSDTNVGHPYCGCKLRLGYGFNGGPVEWSHGYWRQFW